MQKYNKAWGSLIGGIIGIGVAYGFIPAETGSSLVTAGTVILPAVTGLLGTFLSPRNDD